MHFLSVDGRVVNELTQEMIWVRSRDPSGIAATPSDPRDLIRGLEDHTDAHRDDGQEQQDHNPLHDPVAGGPVPGRARGTVLRSARGDVDDVMLARPNLGIDLTGSLTEGALLGVLLRRGETLKAERVRLLTQVGIMSQGGS